jgi:hypothetical protein
MNVEMLKVVGLQTAGASAAKLVIGAKNDIVSDVPATVATYAVWDFGLGDPARNMIHNASFAGHMIPREDLDMLVNILGVSLTSHVLRMFVPGFKQYSPKQCLVMSAGAEISRKYVAKYV